MQRVEEPMETIHLYVVREEEKRPYSLLPLFFAFLCLLSLVALTLYSGEHPLYEHETLTVPAHFFFQNFGISEVVIPTGVRTYVATTAHGVLTVYNGSIFAQEIPQGMILTSSNGIEVVTNSSVFVPAGNPPNFGIATISAHTVVSGQLGNIPSWSINQVYGASLYIRNLTAFYDGQDSYSVKVVTQQDRQTAIDIAKASLTAHVAHIQAILAKPCKEVDHFADARKLVVAWTCQFAKYPFLPRMKVSHVRLEGKNFFVDVLFVARPKMIWAK